MREYGFPLTLIFPYEDRIVACPLTRKNRGESEKTRILADSILIRESTGQQKLVLSHILRSVHFRKVLLVNVKQIFFLLNSVVLTNAFLLKLVTLDNHPS